MGFHVSLGECIASRELPMNFPVEFGRHSPSRASDLGFRVWGLGFGV